MSALVNLIKKNLKILLRSKSSALIIILGPLLIIFLVGIAFDNNSLYRINLGAYSQTYSDLSNAFITDLDQSGFSLNKYVSEDSCIEGVRRGEVHICMVFSPAFAINSDQNNKILFYADLSRVNLIYNILDTASKRIALKSSEISMNLTDELIAALERTKRTIKKKRPLLVAMTTQNNKLKRYSEAIYQNMEELEIDFDKDVYNTFNLSVKGDDIKFMVASMQD